MSCTVGVRNEIDFAVVSVGAEGFCPDCRVALDREVILDTALGLEHDLEGDEIYRDFAQCPSCRWWVAVFTYEGLPRLVMFSEEVANGLPRDPGGVSA